MSPVVQPGLVERAIRLIPLPYILACMLAALVIGPPTQLLFHFFDTGDIGESFTRVFAGLMPAEAWQQVASFILWTAQAFYTFWSIRYTRQKIIQAESELAPLLPGGYQAFRQAFRHTGRFGPVLLLALLLIPSVPLFLVAALFGRVGASGVIYNAIRIPIIHIAYATMIWMYASALWGVYRLGAQPLRFKPFYEDGMMGARPLGALSLSLALVYFGNIGILTVIALISPVYSTYPLLLAALIVLGTAMFFLPLRSVHAQMAKEKGRWQQLVSTRMLQFARMIDPPPMAPQDPGPTGNAGMSREIADLRVALALESVERKVNAITTWPFDTGILARLAVLVTPILVGVVTQLLLTLFGFG